MGWDSNTAWTKKVDAINETKADYLRNGYNILKSKNTSQAFYLVVEKDNVKRLVVYLFERHAKDIYRKGMSAECGPYVNDCPLDFFDGIELKGFAAEFKERCEAYWNKKEKLKVDLVGREVLIYGKKYKVLVDDKRYVIVENETGKYRHSKRKEMELV